MQLQLMGATLIQFLARESLGQGCNYGMQLKEL